MGTEQQVERSEGLVQLTEWETSFMTEHSMCPDCEVGPLMQEPKPGLSRNVMCGLCRTEFNITFLPENKIAAKRLTIPKTGP